MATQLELPFNSSGAEADGLCFWHPVGPHVGETLDEIRVRKEKEVARHGFTLWAFAPARLERVSAWRAELARAGLGGVPVICSGRNGRDPASGRPALWTSEHSADPDDGKWSRLPSPRMTSYHRGMNGRGVVASAFYVTAIESAPDLKVSRPSEWFHSSEKRWIRGGLPTRGEYLVRMPHAQSDSEDPHVPVRFILRVEFPFVVWVR